MPKRNESTRILTAQARLSPVELAHVYQILSSYGYTPRSMSDLLYSCTCLIAANFPLSEPLTSADDAISFLMSRGLAFRSISSENERRKEAFSRVAELKHSLTDSFEERMKKREEYTRQNPLTPEELASLEADLS